MAARLVISILVVAATANVLNFVGAPFPIIFLLFVCMLGPLIGFVTSGRDW